MSELESRISELEKYCAVNDQHWIRHDDNAQSFRNEVKLIMQNMEKTIDNRLEIMSLSIAGLEKSFKSFVNDSTPILDKVRRWEAQMTAITVAYAGIAGLITFVASNWSKWFQ